MCSHRGACVSRACRSRCRKSRRSVRTWRSAGPALPFVCLFAGREILTKLRGWVILQAIFRGYLPLLGKNGVIRTATSKTAVAHRRIIVNKTKFSVPGIRVPDFLPDADLWLQGSRIGSPNCQNFKKKLVPYRQPEMWKLVPYRQFSLIPYTPTPCTL